MHIFLNTVHFWYCSIQIHFLLLNKRMLWCLILYVISPSLWYQAFGETQYKCCCEGIFSDETNVYNQQTLAKLITLSDVNEPHTISSKSVAPSKRELLLLASWRNSRCKVSSCWGIHFAGMPCKFQTCQQPCEPPLKIDFSL